jgi:hypothetical protein
MTNFNVDANKAATFRQVDGVSYKIAKDYLGENKLPAKELYKFSRRVKAILLSQNPEGLTHGQVQSWFEGTKVPKFVNENMQVEDKPVKASKPKAKAKATRKPSKAQQVKILKATDNPSQPTESLADRMTKLEELMTAFIASQTK